MSNTTVTTDFESYDVFARLVMLFCILLLIIIANGLIIMFVIMVRRGVFTARHHHRGTMRLSRSYHSSGRRDRPPPYDTISVPDTHRIPDVPPPYHNVPTAVSRNAFSADSPGRT